MKCASRPERRGDREQEQRPHSGWYKGSVLEGFPVAALKRSGGVSLGSIECPRDTVGVAMTHGQEVFMPDKFRNKRKLEKQQKAAKHGHGHSNDSGMSHEYSEQDQHARGGMGDDFP